MSREVVIVSAVRTAIGRFGGSLSGVSAADLGAEVVRGAVARSDIDPALVDEVILGCVLQAGQGQNVARQAGIKAGLPANVPGMTINKVCGSGMKAVVLAAQAIASGDADAIVAGGTESMSQAPYLIPKARYGYRMGHGILVDAMVQDGLWCAFDDIHMGESVERLAERLHISRQAQDAFALSSQQRTARAWQDGRFVDEIVPMTVAVNRAVRPFDRDEHPRPDTTMAALAALKPAFRECGTVTAGNASGLSDGAAALLLTSLATANRLNLPVMGRFVAGASAALDPGQWPLGPIEAVKRLLDRTRVRLDDVELIECNEAFAAQTLAVISGLGLDREIVNVNGGAVALGHPIGASGARILVTLLHEMVKRGVHRGMATLCIGGGQGMAILVDR
jgi:acetyl-CoA C-acetyltransferase